MKELIRYGLTLGLICVIASASLAGVNSLTKSKIIAQAKIEEENSLKGVLPQAFRFEPVKLGEDIIYYKAYSKDGAFIGAAFKASAKGYSSVIETMAGMTKDGSLNAIKILSQNETPGLGSRIAEPPFLEKFARKNIQDLGGIAAITGATISSRAVIESVSKKAKEIKELIKNER